MSKEFKFRKEEDNVLRGKCLELGYVLLKDMYGKYFVSLQERFNKDRKNVEEFISRKQDERSVLDAFNSVRHYFIEQNRIDCKSWGIQFDYDHANEYATEMTLLELRNIKNMHEHRTTRMTLNSIKSDALLSSHRLVLLENESAKELIDQVNLWLENEKYELFDLKLGVSYHEHMSINIAILQLNDKEKKRIANKRKVNKSTEQN